MTIEARYNLQRGIPENRVHKRSDYHVENALDAYIVQRAAIKNNLLEDSSFIEAVEAELEECIAAAVEEILKNFD